MSIIKIAFSSKAALGLGAVLRRLLLKKCPGNPYFQG
jgi:hypothetical protein